MLILMNSQLILFCLLEHNTVVIDVYCSDACCHMAWEVLTVEEGAGLLVEGLEFGVVSIVDENGA